MFPCISSCSTAAALNVSAAARHIEKFSFNKKFATLAIEVVLPEPLIPTKAITKGDFSFKESFIFLIISGGFIRTFSMVFKISSSKFSLDRFSPISFSF